MTELEKEHKEFVAAASAVFAWVSAADGEISKLEISRFIEYLSELSYVDEITDDDFNELYLSLLEAFDNDFEDGLSRAQTRIESFSGDLNKSMDLVRAARQAMLADGILNEAEEEAIQSIAKLLGIIENNT